MQFSHSRVSTFKQCKYKFYLKYIKGFKTLFNHEANNPLIVGNLFHHAIEKGTTNAIKEYYDKYNIISNEHINEVIKLEYLYPKIIEFIKINFPNKSENEIELNDCDFKGFIDLVVNNEDGSVDLIDFKYSNNIKNYMESGQLHEYKYFFEKQFNKKVNKLYFMFIPKVQIRQKKTEDIFQFRKRLYSELEKVEIILKEIKYDSNKIIEFAFDTKKILEETEYEKNITKLCDWCEYKEYCLENKNYIITNEEEQDMQLPGIERRQIGFRNKKKIWIYGQPTSGKTTMLDGAPNPLNLNTDGNIEDVTMPYIAIKDEVTVTGRMTNRKMAWEVLKETMEELEKKQNEFKTIIIDLVEDTREMCRLYMYDKLGIQHESDSGYGKGWDIIKTEYLSTMKRFFNLDYENLVIVSHEDVSKDITKKTGDKITRIAPTIQEALANKLAGMVDIVGRVVVEDNGARTLNFKSNEVVFGGTRLKGIKNRSIELSWDALMEVYSNRNEKAHCSEVLTSVELDEKPKRKGRKSKEEVKGDWATDDTAAIQNHLDDRKEKLPPEDSETGIAEEDKYYHHEESGSYFMIKKGEPLPSDAAYYNSYGITKEEYEEAAKKLEESNKNEEETIEAIEPKPEVVEEAEIVEEKPKTIKRGRKVRG